MAWWPTKGAASRSEYAGTAECAKCHFATAASQLLTEMARASTRSMDPETLDGHKTLTFQQPPYSYEILRSGDQVLGSVRDERSSISRPLLFAFGKGNVGHTYIYKAAGNLFESRVSYYTEIGGLDLTTGHPHSPPRRLEKALGRLLNPKKLNAVSVATRPSRRRPVVLIRSRVLPGYMRSLSRPGFETRAGHEDRTHRPRQEIDSKSKKSGRRLLSGFLRGVPSHLWRRNSDECQRGSNGSISAIPARGEPLLAPYQRTVNLRHLSQPA